MSTSGNAVGSRVEMLVGIVAVLTLCRQLAACTGVPLHRSDVAERLPDQVAPIAVGQSDRAAVHKRLGEPQLSSDYWRFDLFRYSGKNTALGLLYVVPFTMTVDIDALVLVTYDRNGKVVALDKGINRAVPGWDWHEPSLMLIAGDATVISQVGRAKSVYFTAERRDAYLEGARPRDVCTMVVGCDATRQCQSTLTVAHEVQTALATPTVDASSRRGRQRPLREPKYSSLTALFLAPGNHDLEVRTAQYGVSGAEIHCSAGDLLYVLIDSPIQVSSAMPVAFVQQPMLAYREGWLLPQEPSHE